MAVKHIAWMSMLFSISNCTPTPIVNAPQAGKFSSAYSGEDGADKNIDSSGASRSKKGSVDANDATAADLVAGPVGPKQWMWFVKVWLRF